MVENKTICACLYVINLCMCTCVLVKPRTDFQQVMHLPCDVQHVVSWSSMLYNPQSSQQTHRCPKFGDVQRHGEWLAGIAAQQYNGTALSVGRV